MSDKQPTAAFGEEILLIAEKLGQVSDRLERVEREFTAQTAPIDGSKAAIDGAVAALGAALAGIKALDAHVLSNDLGAVSKRVDAVAAQADTALRALEAQIAAHAKSLEAAKAETAKAFSDRDTQRIELAQKREADARDFAERIDGVRKELSQHLAALADSIKQFETPSSFNPRGAWDALTKYRRLDVVELNGTSYVAAADTSEKPARSSKAWTTLARRGAAAGGGGMTPEPASLQSLPAGATIAWDLINPVATVTIGAAANVFTFNNARDGGTYILAVVQDGSGSRTVTWPSDVRWPGNVAPVLTTTANRADVFSFVRIGSLFYGSVGQNYVTT